MVILVSDWAQQHPRPVPGGQQGPGGRRVDLQRVPDAGWPQTADQASLSRLSQGAEGAQGHCLLLKVESIFSQNACGAMVVAQVVRSRVSIVWRITFIIKICYVIFCYYTHGEDERLWNLVKKPWASEQSGHGFEFNWVPGFSSSLLFLLTAVCL